MDKLGRNVPVRDILLDECKVGQSTNYDVKYVKEKLRKTATEQDVSSGSSSEVSLQRMRMSGVCYDKLNAAVFDWYKLQKTSGLKKRYIRGVNIHDAVNKFAAFSRHQRFPRFL